MTIRLNWCYTPGRGFVLKVKTRSNAHPFPPASEHFLPADAAIDEALAVIVADVRRHWPDIILPLREKGLRGKATRACPPVEGG